MVFYVWMHAFFFFFGPGFISWVKILYVSRRAKTRLLVNNTWLAKTRFMTQCMILHKTHCTDIFFSSARCTELNARQTAGKLLVSVIEKDFAGIFSSFCVWICMKSSILKADSFLIHKVSWMCSSVNVFRKNPCIMSDVPGMSRRESLTLSTLE